MTASLGSLLATSYGNGSLLSGTPQTDPQLAAIANAEDSAKTTASQATAALDANDDGTISPDEAKAAPHVLAQLSAESLNTILGYMQGNTGSSSTSSNPMLSAMYQAAGLPTTGTTTATTPTPATGAVSVSA